MHINQSYVSILHLGTNNLRYNGEPFDILHYYEEIVQYANTIQNAHIILTGKSTSNLSWSIFTHYSKSFIFVQKNQFWQYFTIKQFFFQNIFFEYFILKKYIFFWLIFRKWFGNSNSDFLKIGLKNRKKVEF